MAAPKQPTTQVRQPDSPDTKTIETNDPITNKEEERLAREGQEEQDRVGEEQRKQQEEDAKREQENFKAKQEMLKQIVQSNEGYIVRDEGNQEALDLAMADGSVYCVNVQSGKGGLDVEERIFLSDSGTSQLKTAFGPSMGVGKEAGLQQQQDAVKEHQAKQQQAGGWDKRPGEGATR